MLRVAPWWITSRTNTVKYVNTGQIHDKPVDHPYVSNPIKNNRSNPIRNDIAPIEH